MDKEEIIRRLKKISEHAVHVTGEPPFIISLDDGIALDEAVSMLKEQEWQTKRLTPTEPNVSINAYGVKFYYCPHCKRPILKSGIIGRPRHCEDCGQAVKWKGDDSN